MTAAGENLASTVQSSAFSQTEASLVRALLGEATSAIIVHDGSFDAQSLVHHLVTNAPTPLQVNGASRVSRPAESLSYPDLNTERGVAVLVFSNVTQAMRVVSELNLEQVTSPLLLLGLSPVEDERYFPSTNYATLEY